MFYLILAILSSTLVSVSMRLSEKHIKNNLVLLLMNYVICSLLAAFYMNSMNFFPNINGSSYALLLGAINGCLYLAGFIALQFNIKENGVVLSSTFSKLGILVPIVMSILLFHEMPQLLQVIGFIFAIIAIFIIYFEKEALDHFQIGLIFLLLTNGSADVMSKVFNEYGNQQLSNHFLFYTFLFAFLICLILVITKKQKIGKEEIMFGFIVGIPNYFSARFLLLSLQSIPGIIAYPTYSVGTIVCISIIGIFLFHERISTKQRIGISIILLALILLNI